MLKFRRLVFASFRVENLQVLKEVFCRGCEWVMNFVRKISVYQWETGGQQQSIDIYALFFFFPGNGRCCQARCRMVDPAVHLGDRRFGFWPSNGWFRSMSTQIQSEPSVSKWTAGCRLAPWCLAASLGDGRMPLGSITGSIFFCYCLISTLLPVYVMSYEYDQIDNLLPFMNLKLIYLLYQNYLLTVLTYFWQFQNMVTIWCPIC